MKHALDVSDAAILSNIEDLLNRNLIPVFHGPEIAHFLGVSPKIVSLMAAKPGRFYNRFKVTKRNGGHRMISAPRVFIKQTQRYILDCIIEPLDKTLPSCVVGFRRGISLKSSASRHVGNSFLWTIDLTDFFPSVKHKHVVDFFSSAGYGYHAAEFLAKLCTLNGELPQGAPTSPSIANHVFSKVDQIIISEIGEEDIEYTRYADDLSFSSDNPIPQSFRKRIVQIVNQHEFQINKKKERLVGPASRREVTGCVINEKVSVPRPRRREIRAIFHKAKRSPLDFIKRRSELMGYVGWFESMALPEARKMRSIAENIPT